MQLRDYRLSDYRLRDYRLAAYVVVAAVIAGGVAFGLDRAFAPAAKVEANGAPPAATADGAVRQIPIGRTTKADLGDPEGKLTPVYPANPGKDLPIKDTPIIQAVKPAAAAATNGSASTAAPAAAPAPAPVANAAATASAPPSTATPQANACNVEVCAAAYRSFRESDCTYQPFEGPRRICEGAPDNAQAAAPPPQSQPQQQARPQFDTRSAPQISRRNYDDALRDAERTVRRLPPPGSLDDEDPRGVIVMESPEQRYELRRNWVSEPQD